jgi:hypothetical protein
MESVRLNNTLQEDWTAKPDSNQQWSHCAVVPLYIAVQGLAGLWPLTPGFRQVEVRPQLADLAELHFVVHTVHGPIRFGAEGKRGDRAIIVELPSACEGELIVPEREQLGLTESPRPGPPGHRRYHLPGGVSIQVNLRHS